MTTDEPLTRLTVPDPHTVRAWVVKITAVDTTQGLCTIDPNDGDLVTEVPYWGSAPGVGSVQVALLFDGLLGVISTGTGQGSSVPVSGVWPIGELAPFGAAASFPSTAGQPIYLDSAGQIRAQPMVMWRDNPLIGDAPTVFPMGMSILTLSSTQAAAGGWPLGTSALVTTFRRYNDTVCAQYWQRNSTVTPQILYRVGNDTNTPKWSPWVEIVGPDLPDPVEAYIGADQAIGAIPRYTETPTAVRATVTNPSQTQRMLVRQNVDLWADLATVGAGFYLDCLTIGGATIATNPVASNVQIFSPVARTYQSVTAEAQLWVAPSTTATVGVGIGRLAPGTLTIRYTRNRLTPIRFAT